MAFKLGAATPHIIYGFNNRELDLVGATDTDITGTMYGVHVVIPVAKTFLIRPELMFYDYDDSAKVPGATVDMGTHMIAGICFMIAF